MKFTCQQALQDEHMLSQRDEIYFYHHVLPLAKKRNTASFTKKLHSQNASRETEVHFADVWRKHAHSFPLAYNSLKNLLHFIWNLFSKSFLHLSLNTRL